MESLWECSGFERNEKGGGMACLGMHQLWYRGVWGFESADSSLPQLPQDNSRRSIILHGSELALQYYE